MSKWVIVKCISAKEVMVEVENNEGIKDALTIVKDMMPGYEDFKSVSVIPDYVETFKKQADEVFSLND